MGPWLEQMDPYPNRTRQQFDGAPFGCAQVTIDPTSTEAAASFNRNRIYLCGRSGGVSHEGLTDLIDLFTAKGIKRAFVWLSPGPEMETVREWFRSLHLERVVWTRYPTVALRAPAEMFPRSAFEIRTVNHDEVAAAREQFGLVTMTGFEESVGRDGFHHYMAFDAGRPIATAALVQFEDIGYLTYAHTSESDRRRGAQTALIARRIEDARNLGCTHVISQTLTMLKSSFANLQRCGFREIYDQEVYELRTD
jgi:L-amino acid N-acyltransferase YncA